MIYDFYFYTDFFIKNTWRLFGSIDDNNLTKFVKVPSESFLKYD